MRRERPGTLITKKEICQWQILVLYGLKLFLEKESLFVFVFSSLQFDRFLPQPNNNNNNNLSEISHLAPIQQETYSAQEIPRTQFSLSFFHFFKFCYPLLIDPLIQEQTLSPSNLMWVFTANDVDERWHTHGRSKNFEPRFKVCTGITTCTPPYSLNSHKDYCFLVFETIFLPKFLPIPFWFFLCHLISRFLYLLMLSTPCGAGGYIILRTGVVGLEHKQKLELRLDLKNILFADSFGWYTYIHVLLLVNYILYFQDFAFD